MLKVNDGTVIEGKFEDDQYIEVVKESNFATLIVHVSIFKFEDKCIELTSALADEGKQYGVDYVIARTRAGTFGNEGMYES